MDIATVLGMVLCAVFVIVGIISGDQGPAALGNFKDFTSALVTFGGSFACILESSTLQGYISGLKSIVIAIKGVKFEEGEIIKSIIDLSNVARKEGLLALEEAANNLEDPFLKKGILLIVDGTDPELVRGIMETELTCIEDRHNANISFWDNLGSMGPAWGMIGTLIGLINMLKLLDDPSSIGPNMAVALITTLYGSLLANWICIPISTKLKADNAAEVVAKSITIEGFLSIQAGENPRVIEEKLKSFLAPDKRNTLSPEEGGRE